MCGRTGLSLDELINGFSMRKGSTGLASLQAPGYISTDQIRCDQPARRMQISCLRVGLFARNSMLRESGTPSQSCPLTVLALRSILSFAP